jgi:hypothetical protein
VSVRSPPAVAFFCLIFESSRDIQCSLTELNQSLLSSRSFS